MCAVAANTGTFDTVCSCTAPMHTHTPYIHSENFVDLIRACVRWPATVFVGVRERAREREKARISCITSQCAWSVVKTIIRHAVLRLYFCYCQTRAVPSLLLSFSTRSLCLALPPLHRTGSVDNVLANWPTAKHNQKLSTPAVSCAFLGTFGVTLSLRWQFSLDEHRDGNIFGQQRLLGARNTARTAPFVHR